VQPLKVLQVAVEEWILVVPLDFERDDAAIGEGTDMIDLMGDRLPLDAVDALFDREIDLVPAQLGQGAPETLSALCLASTRADDLLNWDG
jgi:hypothetical protein